LTATRNLDPSRVYQILLLLFFSEYSGDIPGWPLSDSTRREVYWAVYRALENLRIENEQRAGLLRRFGVHDVETVYGEHRRVVHDVKTVHGERIRNVWDIPPDTVVEDLLDWQGGKRPGESAREANVTPTVIDLVVYGELKVRSERLRETFEPQETFELTLRARDLLSQRDLSFHDVRPPGRTQVLADIHGTVGDPEYYVAELPSKVLKRIPRLQGEVSFARSHWYSLRRSDVRIDIGEDQGVFEGMRLYFYTKGDPNRICAGETISVDRNWSQVSHERGRILPAADVIAVTK
jgi:hypothetical protein